MAAPDLGDGRKDDGKVLLDALRADGVMIFAAFWNYTSLSEEWRLVIVTPQVESRGPKQILRQIYRALQGVPGGASFTFFDVSLKSPRSPDIMHFINAFPLPLGQDSTYKTIQVGDMLIDSMFNYYFNAAEIVEQNKGNKQIAAE